MIILYSIQGKGEVLTYWLIGEDKVCRMKRISQSEQGQDSTWLNYRNNNYERIGSVNQNSSHSNLISDDCYKQNGIVPSPIHRGSSLRHNWKGDKSSPSLTSKHVDFRDRDYGSADTSLDMGKSFELSPLIAPSQKLSPSYEHAPLTLNIEDE